ncbi:MAG: efflux transporter outer membrane subunit [Opitutaceae bacterium]
MNRLSLVLLGGLALGAGGCTLEPRYRRPAAPVPTQWPATGGETAATPAAPATAAWRDFVTDPKIRQVVALALQNNRDLRTAALNVELARATYGIQRDLLFPSVTAQGNGGKQRASAELTEAGRPRTTESYSASLGVLAWEVDFFGRVRSLNREAWQKYQATEEARRSAQTLLVSNVVAAYLSLAADHDALALAERTLQTQQATYDLVRRQFDAGIATALELHQAQTPLETARASRAQSTRAVAQAENALNLLAGTTVPADLQPAGLAAIDAFREVAAGLPSTVLLGRPDVLQAEHALQAANADIGAARAAFFPRISLTGTLGSGSRELSGLFEGGTGTWSFLPSATMPIFDARTWTAHRAAKVQRELAVAQYEKAVQSAFREVADALATRATIGEQLAAQERLVEALAETDRLATARYERGVDSYLVALDAQRSLFAARQGLVSLRLAALTSRVQLYAALGGGAEPEPRH